MTAEVQTEDAEPAAQEMEGVGPQQAAAACAQPAEPKHFDHELVARNSITYFVTQLGTWALTFLATSIAARYLGESNIGLLTLAGTTVGTVFGFSTLSIDSFLVAEVGRCRADAERLLGNVLGLRLALALPVSGITAYLLLHLQTQPVVVWIGLLSILASWIGYASEPMRSVLAGREEAKRVSSMDALLSVVPFVTLPLLPLGLVAISTPGVIVAAIILFIRIRWLRRYMHIRFLFEIPQWARLIKGGAQYVVNDLATTLYRASAVFILHYYADEANVGVYAQAQKLMGTFLFLPTALGTALLPSLARLADHRPEQLRALRDRTLMLMLVLSLPIAAMAILLAHPVCRILYGPVKFQTLPPVLQVYALNSIPLYIVSTLYQFLVAERRNAVWSVFLIGTVVLNGALCVWLVPWMQHTHGNGALGAAYSGVAAEAITVLAAFHFLKTNPVNRRNYTRLIGSIVATAALVGVVWLTRRWFVLVPAMLGIAVYSGLAWVLRVFGREEQQKMREIARTMLPALAGVRR